MARAEEVTLNLTVKQRQALRDLDKFRQSIGRVAKYAAGLGGILGGIGFMAIAKKAVFTAARFDELGLVVDQVAKNMGHDVEYIHQLDDEIRAVGVTTDVSRIMLTRFMQQNLDLGKAVEFATAAQNAATMAGKDTSESIQHGIEAIIRLEPRMLRTAGFYVQLEHEYKKVADATGRNRDDLTTQERQQIALNASIREAGKLTGLYGLAMQNAGKQWRTWVGRELKTFFAYLGNVGMPAFEALVDWLRATTQATIEWLKANQEALKQKVAEWVEDAGEKLRKYSRFLIEHRDVILAVGKALVFAAIAIKIGEITHSIILLAKWLKMAAPALLAFAVTPVGAIITAVGLAAAAISYFILKSKLSVTTTETLGGKIRKLAIEYERLAAIEEKTRMEKSDLEIVSRRLAANIPKETLAILEQVAAVHGLASAYDVLVQKRVASELVPVITDLLGEQDRLNKVMRDNRQEFGNYQTMLDIGVPRPPKSAGARAYETAAMELLTVQKTLAAAEADLADLLHPKKEAAGLAPPPGAAEAAKTQWEAILKALHRMRLDTIRDQYDKEIATVQLKYQEFQEMVAKATELTEGERREALEAGLGWYLAQTNEAERKRLDREAKSAKEATEVRIAALKDELDYRRQLLGWSQADYIAALRAETAAFMEGTEERKAAELALQEAIREGEIATAEARRSQTEDYLALLKSGMSTFIMQINDLKSAWKSVGSLIINFVVNYALESMISAIRDAIKAAQTLKATMAAIEAIQGLSMFMGGIPGLQHGGYVKKPRVVRVAETQAEIISPVPKMVEAVKTALAESGGGGAGLHLEINMPVMALDAASFDERLKGDIGEAIARNVRQAWIQLQGAT